MALLINNDVQHRVLKMSEAVEAMEAVLKQYANGLACFQPRTDLWSPTASNGDYFRWGSLLGAMYDPPTLAFRFKSDILTWEDKDGHTTEEWHNMEPGKYCGFVILIDMSNGEIIALMNDGVIQHARVGATAAVGAKYLAREDASVLGVIGSGGMARAYTEAICTVRNIETIKVWSPTPANREKFAEEMHQKLGVNIFIADNNFEVVERADIVALCTDSREPIYTADMLDAQSDGGLVIRCRIDEIDETVFSTVDRIVGMSQDSMHNYEIGSEQEKKRRPLGKPYLRRYKENNWPLLADIIIGKEVGRNNEDQKIFFDNNSAGLQFAAVGRLIYEEAKRQGLGMHIPMEWFHQDIRN
jgi:alanine dehydrogenase